MPHTGYNKRYKLSVKELGKKLTAEAIANIRHQEENSPIPLSVIIAIRRANRLRTPSR